MHDEADEGGRLRSQNNHPSSGIKLKVLFFRGSTWGVLGVGSEGWEGVWLVWVYWWKKV